VRIGSSDGLVSPALLARVTGDGIFRPGASGGKNGDMRAHHKSPTAKAQAVSDHGAIDTDLSV
jgi:hypothetical protein